MNADGLSRLPLEVGHFEGHNLEPSVFSLQQIERLPVTAAHLKKAAVTDAELSKILHFVNEGWPPQVEEEFKAYHKRRKELSSEAGCILLGSRAVIPKNLCSQLLKKKHPENEGDFMWWPGLNHDIQYLVKICTACLTVKNTPQVTPLQPWTWPGKP